MCEGGVGNTLTGTWNMGDTGESRWELQSHMMPDFLNSHEVCKGHRFTARRKISSWLIANKHWTAASVSSVPECSNKCLTSIRLERWGVPSSAVRCITNVTLAQTSVFILSNLWLKGVYNTEWSLNCAALHPFVVKMFWVTQDLLF